MLAGIWCEAPRSRRWRHAIAFVLPLLLAALAVLALNARIYDDAWRPLRVYSSALGKLNLTTAASAPFHDATGHWGGPFVALLETPWRVAVPSWKVGYVYGVLTLILFLATRAGRRLWRTNGGTMLERVLFGWLALNSLAAICGGPYWGFHSFDRYTVWAWPAALALNEDLCQRHPHLTALAMALSLGATVFALQRNFG